MAETQAVKAAPGAVVAKDALPPAPPLKWRKFNWWRRLLFIDMEGLVSHGFSTRLEPEDMCARWAGGVGGVSGG